MINFNGLLWLKIIADFIITDNSSNRSNPPQATAVIIISWVKLEDDFEMVSSLETFFNLDSTLFNASDGSMNEKKFVHSWNQNLLTSVSHFLMNFGNSSNNIVCIYVIYEWNGLYFSKNVSSNNTMFLLHKLSSYIFKKSLGHVYKSRATCIK